MIKAFKRFVSLLERDDFDELLAVKCEEFVGRIEFNVINLIYNIMRWYKRLTSIIQPQVISFGAIILWRYITTR